MGGGDSGAAAPRHRDHERAYRHFFGPVFAEGRTRRAGAHVEDSHRRDPLRWQRFCAGVLAVARYDGEGGKGLAAIWDSEVDWQQTLVWCPRSSLKNSKRWQWLKAALKIPLNPPFSKAIIRHLTPSRKRGINVETSRCNF